MLNFWHVLFWCLEQHRWSITYFHYIPMEADISENSKCAQRVRWRHRNHRGLMELLWKWSRISSVECLTNTGAHSIFLFHRGFYGLTSLQIKYCSLCTLSDQAQRRHDCKVSWWYSLNKWSLIQHNSRRVISFWWTLDTLTQPRREQQSWQKC